MYTFLISGYRQIPPSIGKFFMKALLLLVLWKLLYLLVLQPAGMPDSLLKQVTGSTAAKILSLFYNSVGTVNEGYSSVIVVDNRRVLGIAPACTGLELMALYAGVLLCLPVNGKKKLLLFIMLGSTGICLINALRCALLVWIHMEHYSLFALAHKWIFKLAVYFAVFYGWTLYLKSHGKHAQ